MLRLRLACGVGGGGGVNLRYLFPQHDSIHVFLLFLLATHSLFFLVVQILAILCNAKSASALHHNRIIMCSLEAKTFHAHISWSGGIERADHSLSTLQTPLYRRMHSRTVVRTYVQSSKYACSTSSSTISPYMYVHTLSLLSPLESSPFSPI